MQGVGVRSGCTIHVTARAGRVACSTLVHTYQAVGQRLKKISV
jgi:hypothetical protein